MASFTCTLCMGATSFSSRLCIPPATLLHFWRRCHTFSSSHPALLNLRHFSGASKISLPIVKPKLIAWRSTCTRADSRNNQICEEEKDQRSHVAGTTVGKFQKRLRIADIKAGPEQGLERVGQRLSVRGWVRTCRVQRSITFIEVNDGSCLSNIQCVTASDVEGYDKVQSGLITTGTSVFIDGVLVASEGSKQMIELKATKLVLVGSSDPATFPVQKKKTSKEYLRSVAHMRPRTNTFGAVARVRNALAYATHKYFQDMGFVWVASPIITGSDCEGAGQQFCVTTLLPFSQEDIGSPVSKIPGTKDGSIDWKEDFFGKPTFLTVSGQLNAETYASALCDVYTFGPTFRAENSNTSRHLAEFWMIEPELAFANLNDDMACATAYLQYVLRYILDNCKEDMEFFNTWIEKGIIARLNDVAEKEFVQLTYTDAVELLLKAKKQFQFPVQWGCDLQSEHERYITEEAFLGSPVIITDYPKDIKAFYMRQNADGKTVAAMDVLVPKVGELIGGSQREERLELLESRMEELGLDKETYWWYLDLRRYGSGRPSHVDISTEDLNNGTAILKVAWTQKKLALIACNKYPQLLVNIITICISVYEKELQNEVEKKLQISLALEQGLWLLHKLLIKSDDNFSHHFHFDTAEKKLLSMDIINNIVSMARLVIRGFKFDSLHLELGLSCMASIYMQRGLCVIRREDVQVLEVLLRSDEILMEYSMQVKDSVEAIIKYAGHVGVEPIEGNLFKNWIGVYALCATAMALQNVDQK